MMPNILSTLQPNIYKKSNSNDNNNHNNNKALRYNKSFSFSACNTYTRSTVCNSKTLPVLEISTIWLVLLHDRRYSGIGSDTTADC